MNEKEKEDYRLGKKIGLFYGEVKGKMEWLPSNFFHKGILDGFKEGNQKALKERGIKE